VSRSAEAATRPHTRADAGFSLVEIIVSLGVLMIVVATLLPQLVSGIRAVGTARMVTQAKGVAQGELERMRNLPFHISPAAGDYRDVLDYHYRDLVTPSLTPTCTTADGSYTDPQSGWAGYVPDGGARCDYEPATGAFYRTVRQVPATTGSSAFTVVVSTQFLSGATPPQPVTPTEGYDSQSDEDARPPSTQLGATATALYAERGTLRPVSLYTQIADQPVSRNRVNAEVNVAALEVGSVTVNDGAASLSAGLLNLVGTLTYASTATANLTAASGGLATGEQGTGASAALAAPATTTASTVTGVAGALSSGCDIACWGGTRLDLAELSADDGLPRAGSVTAPMQSLLTDAANGGVSFGNTPGGGYRTRLRLAPPLVRLDQDATPVASGISSGCAPGATGVPSYLTASGYLRTTDVEDATEPATVEACGVARSASMSLFPTSFAPRGVVLVELRHASARCLVQGTDHAASVGHDFEAVVSYWDAKGPGTEDDAYTEAATIVPGMTTDPLTAVSLDTVVREGVQASDDLVLGDYIESWASLTADKVIATQTAGTAEVNLPGVVTVASAPVRNSTDGTPDETSVVSLALGAVRCSAEDAR
jgi:type II secretory pathway pseudopilin PulG